MTSTVPNSETGLLDRAQHMEANRFPDTVKDLLRRRGGQICGYGCCGLVSLFVSCTATYAIANCVTNDQCTRNFYAGAIAGMIIGIPSVLGSAGCIIALCCPACKDYSQDDDQIPDSGMDGGGGY